MKFSDSVSAKCRWSEYTEELFGDWDIIWEESEADYQGKVNLLAHKEGKFAYFSYEYGSCGGCDPWEDMPEEKIRAYFAKMIEHFEDVQALQKFADKVHYGKSFEQAVAEISKKFLTKEAKNDY